MTWAWWTRRSMVAAATTSSPRVSPQRENARFDVTITDLVSYLEAMSWKNNAADAASQVLAEATHAEPEHLAWPCRWRSVKACASRPTSGRPRSLVLCGRWRGLNLLSSSVSNEFVL